MVVRRLVLETVEDERRELRRMSDCRFVEADEFLGLAISSKSLVRSDEQTHWCGACWSNQTATDSSWKKKSCSTRNHYNFDSAAQGKRA